MALDRPQVQQAVDGGDHRARSVLASLRAAVDPAVRGAGRHHADHPGRRLPRPALGRPAAHAARSPGWGCPPRWSRPSPRHWPSSSPPSSRWSSASCCPSSSASPRRCATAARGRAPGAPLPGAHPAAHRRAQRLAPTACCGCSASTPQEELSGARTPQELAALVRRSAEAGTLDEGTALLVTRSLDFGERTAADVMTARVRCTAIDRTPRPVTCSRLARRTGHSRFPVIGEDWDDVDGLVHVKRAIGGAARPARGRAGRGAS